MINCPISGAHFIRQKTPNYVGPGIVLPSGKLPIFVTLRQHNSCFHVSLYHFPFCVKGGRGLHSTINSHSKKFVGILNGIDTDAWDPSSDTFLKVQYNADDLQGKVENKKVLREELKLSSADSRQPLVKNIPE